MGYLLPALTEAKFTNQRDVVLNERRQNYENRPYGLAPMAIARPRSFRPIIRTTGRRSARSTDLKTTRLDEVRAFFQRYYHPAQRARSRLPATSARRRRFDLAERVLRRDQPRPSRSRQIRSGRRR